MALEYLKVFGEIEEFVEPLTDEQRGRVFSAMMAYAFRGEIPAFDRGSAESIIWPAIRNKIDFCEKKVKQKRANGANGGRPRKNENQEKPEETEGNQEKANKTSNEHEHVHEQVQEQEEEEETTARARANATAAADCPVCAQVDDGDLRVDIARYQLAEDLIRRYGLPPLDTSRDAIISDLAQYGEERVRGALERAAMSDSRGGISLNFYRLKLRDTGQATPRVAPAAPVSSNPFAALAAKYRAEEGRT